MRAIRVNEFGGPEVLELVEDAPMPEPGEGEVLIHVNRAGVNYADTHAAENSYLAPYETPKPIFHPREMPGAGRFTATGTRDGSGALRPNWNW